MKRYAPLHDCFSSRDVCIIDKRGSTQVILNFVIIDISVFMGINFCNGIGDHIVILKTLVSL